MSIAAAFTAERLAALLPAPGTWRPFPPVSISPNDQLLRQVRSLRAGPWPLLTASMYARFSADGNRQEYEAAYFARRTRLVAAVAGLLLGEDTAADITDGVWLICEETSWCVPAHDGFSSPLPDPGRPYVDLFAADTAALLAHTWHLAGEALSPLVRERLRAEVRRRVLRPFRERDDWWWLGNNGETLNNWTTWILSAILPASLLLDAGQADIRETCSRSIAALEAYLDGVPGDGGCDEGIHYWWKAGAALFECLETLSAACGGDFGVFADPKLRAIARYPLAAHIAGQWQVNFADGHARAGTPAFPELLYRFGRAVGDEEVVAHAVALRRQETVLRPSPDGSLHRLVAELLNDGWRAEPDRGFPLPAQTWLPVTGMLTARSRAGDPRGVFLAAKAGHNDESHNHNDVGSFIVALDGVPLLIDAGTGVYTAQTFGPGRYELWTTQSSWHNVPEIDGFGQEAGRGYAARDVHAALSDDGAELTLDLAGAYPRAAGIISWRRMLRLDRTDQTLVLTDDWDLNHPPGRLLVHLLASRPPSRMADGVAVLPAGPAGTRDLEISWTPGTLDPRVTERPIDDDQLAASWGDAVYRIALSVRSPARRGSLRLRMRPAG